ncbi:hypothetical protein EAO68_37500 [Streptomyces sp. wa22]|nr:hypothetical protein EAO68_37500 [Streptomyces sp. wa22]
MAPGVDTGHITVRGPFLRRRLGRPVLGVLSPVVGHCGRSAGRTTGHTAQKDEKETPDPCRRATTVSPHA